MFKQIRLSSARQGILAIAGHAGVAHVFSANGVVQEDSFGFVMLASLMAQALRVDASVEDVVFSEHGTKIALRSHCGGTCELRFPEGFTPWEIHLIGNTLRGQSPLAPQTLTQKVLGRIGGHGSHCSASILCEALAKLTVNSFRACYPEHFLYEEDSRENSTDCFLGGILDFSSTPVACLLTVNASANGFGPDEDTEGNILVGNKKKIMEQLGMSFAPTIVLESKQYHPEFSRTLSCQHFMVRWNEAFDNPVVGACLAQALEEEKLPALLANTAFPRGHDELKTIGAKLAARLKALAQDLLEAESAVQKIAIAAELALIANKELGGGIFYEQCAAQYCRPQWIAARHRSCAEYGGTCFVYSGVEAPLCYRNGHGYSGHSDLSGTHVACRAA